MAVSEWEANKKTIRLASPTATLTIACSNLFAMAPEDRDFILSLLEKLEAYENGLKGDGDAHG